MPTLNNQPFHMFQVNDGVIIAVYFTKKSSLIQWFVIKRVKTTHNTIMLKFTNTTFMNSTYYVKLNISYLYVKSYTLSKLAQKRASCQMTQCHYINIQCWPIISNILWYSPGGYFAGKFQVVSHQSLKYTSKNLTTKIAVSVWASIKTFIKDTFFSVIVDVCLG